ncbi:hypothetical protein [Thaumasiovibrio subtropicus]|uniref:baeRF10 domain-containing protein n=1 Tax=Thaumasiovibrio subtropicus TaxID=1891207 RepID=UPI000B360459|nr:hypothetical protein [Thaumasiovibrio subtropicus]
MKNILQEVFETLRDFLSVNSPEQSHMLTVYANLDQANPLNRKERPAWLIELKNTFDNLSEEQKNALMTFDGASLTWNGIEEQIISTLEQHEAKGRSVVVFTDLSDTVVIDLPLPVKTGVYYGIPQVKHMLSQLHRYGQYLVVLFSEREHRTVFVDVPTLVSEGTLQSSLGEGIFLRPGGNKTRTQASERRNLDTERRMLREAAGEINDYFMDEPLFDRIVFGGNLKIAHGVKNNLHHAVAEQLVSIEPIPFDATDEQLRETVSILADEYEAVHDLALIQELILRGETCGRAASGMDEVMDALQNGQVRKLYLPYPMDADDFDTLLIEAVLENVEVELVHGIAAETLREMGGVGAALYYVIR